MGNGCIIHSQLKLVEKLTSSEMSSEQLMVKFTEMDFLLKDITNIRRMGRVSRKFWFVSIW